MFYTFIFLLSIAIIGFFSAYLISAPLYFISYLLKARNRDLSKKIKNLSTQFLCKSIWFLMRIQPWYNAKVKIKMPDHIPFLIISNHRSHLDVFIYLTVIPGIRVVAKKSLFSVPFLGLMMKAFRHIPLEKGNFDSYFEALRKVSQGIHEGDPILIFPEMTRCSLGLKGLQKFQAYPFHFALKEKINILPIVIYGSDHVWPKGKFGISSGKKIIIESLECVQTEKFSSAFELKKHVQSLMEKKYLEIDDSLHQEVKPVPFLPIEERV